MIRQLTWQSETLSVLQIQSLKKILYNILPLIKDSFSEIKMHKYIRHFLSTNPTIQKEIGSTYPPKWWYRYVLMRYAHDFKGLKQECQIFLNKTIKMKVRSQSGIVPLSVFTNGVACPFNCHYCPTQPGMPKSYFADEAAVARAIKFDFDPFEQVKARLIMFYLSGHPISKVELIIQGGTFSFLSKKYRLNFLKRVFDATNINIAQLVCTGRTDDLTAPTLMKAQILNETAFSRLVGITIETRPDYINVDEILFLRTLGITRVELGVQSTNNKILMLINRQHNVLESIQATKLLKDSGFKITYHLMPGLPKSNPNKDLQMLKEIFTNDNFKPDNIKLYPTTVAKSSRLAQWFKAGKYQPYSAKELLELLSCFKENIVPHWVRIQRLVRDLTVHDTVINTFRNNFREDLQKYMIERNQKCLCIRCREVKHIQPTHPLLYHTIDYQASQGTEYFIECLDQRKLLMGLLRLRVNKAVDPMLTKTFAALNNTSLIRELHVFGPVADWKTKTKISVQHNSIGKELIKRAILITKQCGLKKITVISGVGVRNYYRKLGFEIKQGGYMTKSLNRI